MAGIRARVVQVPCRWGFRSGNAFFAQIVGRLTFVASGEWPEVQLDYYQLRGPPYPRRSLVVRRTAKLFRKIRAGHADFTALRLYSSVTSMRQELADGRGDLGRMRL
jgi:hypothetical protein